MFTPEYKRIFKERLVLKKRRKEGTQKSAETTSSSGTKGVDLRKPNDSDTAKIRKKKTLK